MPPFEIVEAIHDVAEYTRVGWHIANQEAATLRLHILSQSSGSNKKQQLVAKAAAAATAAATAAAAAAAAAAAVAVAHSLASAALARLTAYMDQTA